MRTTGERSPVEGVAGFSSELSDEIAPELATELVLVSADGSFSSVVVSSVVMMFLGCRLFQSCCLGGCLAVFRLFLCRLFLRRLFLCRLSLRRLSLRRLFLRRLSLRRLSLRRLSLRRLSLRRLFLRRLSLCRLSLRRLSFRSLFGGEVRVLDRAVLARRRWGWVGFAVARF